MYYVTVKLDILTKVRKIILGQLFFKAGLDFVPVAGWLESYGIL